MKRILSFLLILVLVFSVCAFAEEEDDSEPIPVEAAEEADGEEGDDSNPEPIDMMEDEEEADGSGQEPADTTDAGKEAGEQILKGRVLHYGDDGDDVLALQTRLKDLKYYTGNLSGRFREGTRKAVEEFQADFDLDQTGVADMRTLSILFSLTHRPLRYGSTGDDVKERRRPWRNSRRKTAWK